LGGGGGGASKSRSWPPLQVWGKREREGKKTKVVKTPERGRSGKGPGLGVENQVEVHHLGTNRGSENLGYNGNIKKRQANT